MAWLKITVHAFFACLLCTHVGFLLVCLQVYISFGAFEGALSLLDRIVEEFPKFEGTARVLQIRASLWVRLARTSEAVRLFRYALR